MIATLCLLETASALLGICWTKKTLRDRNYFFLKLENQPWFSKLYRLWQKLSPRMTVKDLQRLLNYQSKFRANAFMIRCINRYSNWDCYKVKKLKLFLLLWENCLHESAFKFWAFTEIELEYNEFKKKNVYIIQSSYLLVQVTLSVTADLRHMYTGFRTVYLKYVF